MVTKNKDFFFGPVILFENDKVKSFKQSGQSSEHSICRVKKKQQLPVSVNYSLHYAKNMCLALNMLIDKDDNQGKGNFSNAFEHSNLAKPLPFFILLKTKTIF